VTPAEDEAVVRAYLRAVVGAPLRGRGRIASTESEFVAVAARWAKRAGVDRRSLRTIGVAAGTLNRAGITQPSAQDLVRAEYGLQEFTIADLANRTCVSSSSVRTTVAEDEAAGVVKRVVSSGRAHRWRRT